LKGEKSSLEIDLNELKEKYEGNVQNFRKQIETEFQGKLNNVKKEFEIVIED